MEKIQDIALCTEIMIQHTMTSYLVKPNFFYLDLNVNEFFLAIFHLPIFHTQIDPADSVKRPGSPV